MTKFKDDAEHIEYKGTDLFKSPHLGNCWHCGELTYWMDISFLAFLCSEECEDAKWDEYLKALQE